MAIATFGAGCFWGVEAFFRAIDGVENATSGYMGGHKDDPSYEEVYTDATGHAEVVQVEYDKHRVSFEQLLEVFWSNHNPTTLNRQGGDVGTRYRSTIFFHDKQQKQLAERSKLALIQEDRFAGRQIVTEIVPAQTFYPAEEYHQNYLARNGLSSCHI